VPYGKRVIGLDAFTALSVSFKSTTAVFYLTSLFPSIIHPEGRLVSPQSLEARRFLSKWPMYACSQRTGRRSGGVLSPKKIFVPSGHAPPTFSPCGDHRASHVMPTSAAHPSPPRTLSHCLKSLVSSHLTCKSHQTASYHGNNYPKPHSQLAPRASHPYTQASQPHSAPLSSSRTLATAASLPIALV
jgi:hypothetical protein